MFKVGDKVKVTDKVSGWYNAECTVIARPSNMSSTLYGSNTWTWLVRDGFPNTPGVVRTSTLQRVLPKVDKKVTSFNKYNVGQEVYVKDNYPDEKNRGLEGVITDLPNNVGYYRVAIRNRDTANYLLLQEKEIGKISSPNSFKPGDKVIDKKGRVGTIAKRYNQFGYPSVMFEGSNLTYGYYAKDLKFLAAKEEEPKFKVGDRVRSKTNNEWQDCIVADFYEPPSVLVGWVRVQKSSSGLAGAFNPQDLELLSPKPEIDINSEDFKAGYKQGYDVGLSYGKDIGKIASDVKLSKIRKLLNES